MDKTKLVSIEVPITATSGTFTFDSSNLLNQKKIKAISIPANPNDDLAAPSGALVADQNVLAAAFLNLVRDADRLMDTIPLYHYQETTGDRRMVKVDWDRFNPGKSTVTLVAPGGTARGTVGTSFLFIVEYED